MLEGFELRRLPTALSVLSRAPRRAWSGPRQGSAPRRRLGALDSTGESRRQAPQLEALEHAMYALNAAARERPDVAEGQLHRLPGATHAHAEVAANDEAGMALVR